MNAQSAVLTLRSAASATAVPSGIGLHASPLLLVDELAEADGGIERVRAAVLHLAIQGRLLHETPQPLFDTPTAEGLTAPFGLPRNWAWRRVGEVGDLKLGRQRSPKNHSGPHMRPYLRVANVYEARIDSSDVLRMNFAPEEAERFLLLPNDVLLNEGQSYELVGRPAIYRGEVPGACFQNTLIRFRPSRDVTSEFALVVFRAYMRTGRFRREAQQTTNIAHLSLGRLGEIEFPLPPLAEQKRIVAKVDQLMALCDELEAKQAKKRDVGDRLTKAALAALTSAETPEEFKVAWERISTQFGLLADSVGAIEEIRGMVLDLAVRGLLPVARLAVTTGDAIVEEARATRGARASAPLAKEGDDNLFALPAGWAWARIGDVFDVVGGLQKTPARAPRKNHYPYLRVENVQRGRLVLDRIERFELEEGELDRLRLARGDLLVVEGNGSEREIGRCALWGGEIEDCVHQNHLIRCRALRGVSPEFTLLFLNSPSGKREMKALAVTTSGLYSLSVGKVRSASVPVPPPDVARHLVQAVDRLMKLCDELAVVLDTRDHIAERLATSLTASASGVM